MCRLSPATCGGSSIRGARCSRRPNFCAGQPSAGKLSLDRPYPAWLGVWPAVLLLLGFSWIELVYPDPAVPLHLAWFAIGYSILTFGGMALFGRDAWLRHGEVFTVVFATFARFAPTQARAGPPRQLLLRPFGAGLLDSEAVSNSMTAFVLLLLATVLFDGASTAPEWTNLESAAAARLSLPGPLASMAVKTAGLIAFWLVLGAAFVGTCAVTSQVAARQRAPLELARSFAFTLVPIAIGYHVAHYLTFLLVQGQYIVPLLSDPFGYGWNLFGTAGYRVDIALVGARFAWYAALAAVLAGHIAAVYLAHRKAMQLFEDRGRALRSQVPLTALMVVYTVVSLSILAEPVVERREPAQPSSGSAEVAVPADAVLPEPGSGRLLAVGPGKVARAKLTYRVLRLGVSRRQQDDDCRSPLFHHVRLSLGRSSRRECALRSRHRRRDRADAPAPGRIARGRDRCRIEEFSRGRCQLHARALHHRGLCGGRARGSGAGRHGAATVERAALASARADGGGGVARPRGVLASRSAAPRRRMARSGPLGAERRLAALVETFARDGYRPDALQSLVSADDARKRWAALAAFHKTSGHLLVTNGPYRLKRWSGESVTLEAFRDLSYPLGVGSFDAYAIPRRGFVTAVEWNGRRATLKGDIEIVEKFQRSHRLTRTPLQSLAPEVARRAAPECRYTIVDDQARVVATGLARLAGDSTFQVDLDGRLPPGRYTMFAMIAIAGNVMNAEIRRIPVTVAPAP